MIFNAQDVTVPVRDLAYLQRKKILQYIISNFKVPSVRLWNFKDGGPKKQDFWPKTNILKGNHCILRIRGAPAHKKLGMILENKDVQKLKLKKMFFNS